MRLPSKQDKKWPADYFPNQPFHAVEAVFENTDVGVVEAELPIWYFICVSYEGANYYEITEREDLAIFLCDLLKLSEAIYLLLKYKLEHLKGSSTDTKPSMRQLAGLHQLCLLELEDVDNPTRVVAKFTEKHSRSYSRLELWELFDGVRLYDGPLLKHITPLDSQNMWLLLTCVIEASYIISSETYKDLDGKMMYPSHKNEYHPTN